jgi:hypothetical protein
MGLLGITGAELVEEVIQDRGGANFMIFELISASMVAEFVFALVRLKSG